MADVPADGSTMGEIVMRGNNVMASYYLDPDATAGAFRGGWFHSGDLGVMHPDGYIELRDRPKDVVISGGENISTIEVEQALMSHPAVLEAAVIGVPDDRWGERPKAFVLLRAGHSATPQELIAHVRTKIARYKAPRDIVFAADLPKTSTGKVQNSSCATLRRPDAPPPRIRTQAGTDRPVSLVAATGQACPCRKLHLWSLTSWGGHVRACGEEDRCPNIAVKAEHAHELAERYGGSRHYRPGISA